MVGFWRRGEEGKRGRGLVAVAVVRRNGIARERMVVADLSRVLDATASILLCGSADWRRYWFGMASGKTDLISPTLACW